ncbi:hypothetical protein AMTRI_Chr07g75970 [Amborella trichopoda]|uniref:cytochrome P450 86B1-like n=1 Tax=Amborella trichopoda TaxID=13333 RepID=UPI0005D350B7|nr:cytochrome P450 86B1-like [Amborella trichopoda]XP_020531030.1 cytochrome P450 86B1-like [Amborella trichopoda]XP_020531031.1 cytochrome P450 86B1-like [Amborella trichopoda]|eukprot:XP_011628156.1 cytochrome P450 86B1-like [Amborella trichopoda]
MDLPIPNWPELLLATICFLFMHYINQRNKPIVSWPLLGMLPSLAINAHCIFEYLTRALNRAHGTFSFLGPALTNFEFILTCDPKNIKHIVKTNFSNYGKGKDFKEIFDDVFGDGIFVAESESWRIQRKMSHAHVQSKDFRTFLATTTQDLTDSGLLPLLGRAARQGSQVDLQDLLIRLTFDSTCTSILGRKAGCLSPGLPVIPFSKAIDDGLEAIFFRHVVPRSWWKLMKRLEIGWEKRMLHARHVIDEFVKEQIAITKSELESKGSSEDLMTSYMSSNRSLSNTFLRDTMVNFLFAGRDASGVALSWFFWLIFENPHTEAKILEELRNVLGGRTSIPLEDLHRLVYLHAALYETLRLYPPVPIDQKAAVHNDILPDGTMVKAGTKIFYSIYSMARMEWIWGKDCREFRPERWIGEGGELKPDLEFKFMSFNAGPRSCLGQDMAFTQMKIAVATILANFQVVVVEGQNVSPKTSVILLNKNGLKVTIKERPLQA